MGPESRAANRPLCRWRSTAGALPRGHGCCAAWPLEPYPLAAGRNPLLNPGRFADAKTEPDAKDEPGWTPSGLYKSIKALMHQAAAELEGADAQRLMKASTHWLRHTHGSHSLASGVVPVEVVRRNMGHASLDTLSGYVTTERDEGIRAIERFVKQG